MKWKIAPAVGGGVCLLLLGWGIVHTPQIDRRVNSPDPQVRLQLVEDLRHDDSRAARAALEQLCGDGDERVAKAAVRALADQDHPDRDRVLLRLLRDCDKGLVRGEAAAALGKSEQVAASHLVRLLREDPDERARAGAAKGLAERADPETAGALFAALKDRSAAVRLWAITGVNRIVGVRYHFQAEGDEQLRRKQVSRIGRHLRLRGLM